MPSVGNKHVEPFILKCLKVHPVHISEKLKHVVLVDIHLLCVQLCMCIYIYRFVLRHLRSKFFEATTSPMEANQHAMPVTKDILRCGCMKCQKGIEGLGDSMLLILWLPGWKSLEHNGFSRTAYSKVFALMPTPSHMYNYMVQAINIKNKDNKVTMWLCQWSRVHLLIPRAPCISWFSCHALTLHLEPRIYQDQNQNRHQRKVAFTGLRPEKVNWNIVNTCKHTNARCNHDTGLSENRGYSQLSPFNRDNDH